MSFSTMLEILQEKHKNYIVLVKTGIFYTATGKDAVFLNSIFDLKCICFKNQICKIGIPEEGIEHYLNKLARMNIAYVVYKFDNKKEKLIEKYKSDGVYHKVTDENKNCLLCKSIRMYCKSQYKIDKKIQS